MTNWEAVELVEAALARGLAVTAEDAKYNGTVTAGPAPGDYRGEARYALRTCQKSGEQCFPMVRRSVAAQFVTRVGRYAARRAVLAAEKAVAT